jgi:hypothetical protein
VHPDTRDTSCRELAAKHGVMTIPAFVVYRPDGSILTTQGVSALQQDPVGDGFPDNWAKTSSMWGSPWLLVLLALATTGCLVVWLFKVQN